MFYLSIRYVISETFETYKHITERNGYVAVTSLLSRYVRRGYITVNVTVMFWCNVFERL